MLNPFYYSERGASQKYIRKLEQESTTFSFQVSIF